MKEQKIILWKGVLKLYGEMGKDYEALIFDTKEMDMERIYELVKRAKPRWRNTMVLSIVGELERLKNEFLKILEEIE